jgi:predicted acylesterase/phospholipase RssA
MSIKKVLVLAGGGAKGIAQTQVLSKLESELEPNRWLHEEYNAVVGTSVGAIHAAIVASGKINIAELNLIEKDMLKKIFGKKNIIPPLYSAKTFANIWNDLIGNDVLMGDCDTRLIITAVDSVHDMNVLFKSWEEKDGNEKLVDVVMRSFAAPLYFGHIADCNNNRVYTDGGVGTNNLPLDEAKLEAEFQGWYSGRNKVIFDAIGCLYTDTSRKCKDVAKDRTIKQLLDFMKPGQGGMARVQSRYDQIRRMTCIANRVKNISFRYWDKCISDKYDGMDKLQYLDLYEQFGIEMSEKPLINIDEKGAI